MYAAAVLLLLVEIATEAVLHMSLDWIELS